MGKHHTVEIDEESPFITHARRELELIGEEPETIQGYLAMIQVFSDMGHSGGSASVFIPTLMHLLEFKNLKGLTNNPNEWNYIADDQNKSSGIWQSARNSEAFSNDGGLTYYLLSEGGNDRNRHPLHIAEDVR